MKMSPLLATLFFSVLLSNIVLPSYAFHPDYTFIETTKSYYKLHVKAKNWDDAIAMCKDEGAELFYPENETELALVLRELQVADYEYESIVWIGISDLRKLGAYETSDDGRPISQVYNKWWPGEPNSCMNDVCRCIHLYIDIHQLAVGNCKWTRHYICKYKLVVEDVATTALEEVKTIIGNASDKLAASLERQAETMQQLAAAEENQSAALQRLTESMQQQAASQTAALERLALALEKLDENYDQIDIRYGGGATVTANKGSVNI